MRNADWTAKILLGLLGAGVWTLLAHNLLVDERISAIAAEEKAVSFDEMTVKRLNVVDDDGNLQVVIANADRFPPPVLQGKSSIQPAGIVFYDLQGNERGGIGVAGSGRPRLNVMILDYLSSDAMGFGITESEKGYDAGFFVRDRVPLDADIMEVGGAATERIDISNENGRASVVLRDSAGKDRVVLSVDRDGEAGFEILDAAGKVVFSAP